MKITKKLAQELYKGIYENVPFEELKGSSRATTNTIRSTRDLKEIVSKLPEYMKAKDFEGLRKFMLVKAPGESYAGRAKGKYKVQTDVLTIWKYEDKWNMKIDRMDSNAFDKHAEYYFNEDTKQTIKNRIIENLEVGLA